MRKIKVISLYLIVVLMFFLVRQTVAMARTDDVRFTLTQSQIDMINESVESSMAAGKIPGVSLAIVSGSEVIYAKGFGYADVRNRIKVTMDTIFELGSNSKAFTGLAMLKLESEGLIDFSAPVEDYIPWLEMRYNGEKAVVTVEQVMNHTSGIPFRSIDKIPESIADDALEETVRTLIGIELQTRPGASYSYATINYNILGLIIELQTGQSYEAYMTENILNPIGLTNTYMFREDTGTEMATGYKINFLRAREFDAPIYRGNIPAGYILSSGNDMALWMMKQLGFHDDNTFDQSLIDRSHDVEFGAPLQQESDVSYTMGWFVNRLTKETFHSGSNPNFSSNIRLDPENGMGIAVLANLNTPFTEEIALNVRDIIQGFEPSIFETPDMFLLLDRVAVMVICVSIGVILFMIVLIARLIMKIKKKQRFFARPNSKGIMVICFLTAFLALLAFFVTQLPRMFFDGIGWRTAAVWGPGTLLSAVAFTGLATLLICLYLEASICLINDMAWMMNQKKKRSKNRWKSTS